MTRESRDLVALLLLFFLLPVAARAAGKRGDTAVAAELDGQWIVLMSEPEAEAREQAERARVAALAIQARARADAAAAAAAARDAEDDDEPAARSHRRRRSGGPMYRQERLGGDTYRQKYASWSCSAASLTIALSLLGRKPANENTEELVIRKLGSNISKKDGLTGEGMQALANVARHEFDVSAKRIDSTEDVAREVKAGHLVVLDVHRRVSGNGHYVVVAGEGRHAGTLHIKDPAPDGGDFEWDSKTLKSALKAGGVSVWND